MMTIMQTLNNRMTPIPLDDVEGFKMFHMKMSMPMIISNRSVIVTFYPDTLEDGTRILTLSSLGNEAIT